MSFNQQDSIYITDTAWVFNDKTRRIIADGYSQGGITTYGDGIIAAFGEAAMFTAQIAGKSKVGFNSSYAKDNIHFILNIFLSLLKSPEVFDKDYLSNCDKQSICEQYYLMDKFFSENRMADIASIFRDDGYEIGQNFKIQGKDAITNYWLALQDRGIKWEHNILELEVFGNTAFQTGTSKLEYTTGNKGETTISFVNYTIIWKKNEKGIWQIYIDHYTKTGQ